MSKTASILPALTLLSILLGCSADRIWQSDFRVGLLPSGVVRHKLISQYVDSVNDQGGAFYLYYFTKGPNRVQDRQTPTKTILFCAGGPGEIFWPNDTLWLQELEDDYRVVYFHLRGAGFSQFPESNVYDRYLRTKYAVKDIEKIFADLKKDDPTFERWDAVVGFSYGTVLAQQYTAKNPAAVAKLVLASPLSRQPFKKNIADLERKQFVNNLANEYGVILENILKFDGGMQTKTFQKQFPKFLELVEQPNYNRDQIIKDLTTALVEIVTIQDTALLSSHPLIDFYEDLKKLEPPAGQLREQQLTTLQKLARYDRQFFLDLKDLRKDGWGEAVQAKKDVEIAARALRIAAQLLMWGGKNIDVKERFKERFRLDMDDLCKSITDSQLLQGSEQLKNAAEMSGIWCEKNQCICKKSDIDINGQFVGSRRVYYNMAVYDGLDAGFLENWSDNSRMEILDLLKKRRWWQRDPFLRTIGFVKDEVPQIWDPGEARYRHSVPTLILRGIADPVTAGKQANYIFEDALLGPRYLIEFDGIGHDLNLPNLTQLTRFPKGVKTGLCGFQKNNSVPQHALVQTKSCIIESFMTNELETFEDVLALYHDMYARSSEHPKSTWISYQPVTCDFTKGTVETTSDDNRGMSGVSTSLFCKAKSNPTSVTAK